MASPAGKGFLEPPTADNPVYLKWAAKMTAERPTQAKTRTEALRRASERRAARPDGFARKFFRPYDNGAAGCALEWDRMGRRQVSEGLEASAKAVGYTFEHLAVTIGTVIHGPDLRRELTQAEVEVIRRTLLERKVVFFRDQHISLDDHARFARYFGPLDSFPFGDHVEGNPNVLRIAGLGNTSANNWHTDVTWMEKPSMGSILHMAEAPAVGGATAFADSHAAWRGLSDSFKTEIQHLSGINDYRGFLANQRRLNVDDAVLQELQRDIPFGVPHPLVRTHPETGKNALYINSGFLRPDSLFDRRTGEPLGAKRSLELVRRIIRQHTLVEYQCRFEYRKGSMAFWDNRACQHRGVADHYPNVRVGHRVIICGDRPYWDPDSAVVSEGDGQATDASVPLNYVPKKSKL